MVEKMKKSILRLLLKFSLLCPLAYFTSVEWLEFNAEKRSKNWPSVKGEFLFIEDEATMSGSGVSYRYKVGETEYVGSRVSFSNNHLPKSWEKTDRANWIKENYASEIELDVFYDPKEPGSSVLMTDSLGETPAQSAVFLALSLITLFLYFCWHEIKVRRKRRHMQ